MPHRLLGPLLVAPALAMIAGLFVVPLVASFVSAFDLGGTPGLANFDKALALYWRDVVFTLAVVAVSTLLIGTLSIALAGYLTLGENPRAVALLRWLYRWPLFVPFIVVGQIARTFLAKNGLMNNALVAVGVLTPLQTAGLLDWRGIVVAFVWKQTPFVALLLAGAMAGLDRGSIEAARNLGASRLRILVEIVVPQVAPTLVVGLVLSMVTMMSVLSVPLMVNAENPTMITADIAFRINAYGDYGVANALGVISLGLTACVAWIYLRQAVRGRG